MKLDIHFQIMPIIFSWILTIIIIRPLQFISPALYLTPETDTCLMPSAWENRILTFRTINSEEIQWLVVSVVQTNGNNDVTSLDVCPTTEWLLDPELFEFNFTAFLYFLFPFATFFVFFLRNCNSYLQPFVLPQKLIPVWCQVLGRTVFSPSGR